MKLCTTKTALFSAILAVSAGVNAEEKSYSSLQEFLKDSTPTGDFNLRYEDVDVDGGSSSDGLTLRSRFGFKTAAYKGFSAVLEVEDVRDVMGIDDEGGLVPDPEVTEIDQAFVQYKTDMVTAKLGRQVITLDGHRFVGHVGWRQDRQTFDAARVIYTPMKDLTVDASYIYKRNRIFAETADANSSDLLLNVSYITPIGKVAGYYYGLDDENEGLAFPQSDTYGGFLSGSTKGDVSFLYHAEIATQSIELDNGEEFDADYYSLEAGVKLSGVTIKVGQELLGSDDGDVSFTTPLATLHKFNGWSDVTLGGVFNPVAMPNGLEDRYFSVGGSVAGINLKAAYHLFSADEGGEDYGSELELQATKKLKGGFVVGAKYAAFSDEEDEGTFGADVDKLWIWTGFKF